MLFPAGCRIIPLSNPGDRRHLPVTVHIPGPLRAHCGGVARLSVSAPTVGAVLDELQRAHPLVYRGVCDETDAVRRHINLFVNTSHVRDLDGLETELRSGDELTILPAVSGG